MDAIEQALAILKPESARVTASQWGDHWGVHIFDGGVELISGNGYSYATACADALEKAKAGKRTFRALDDTAPATPAAAPQAKPRRSNADLFD